MAQHRLEKGDEQLLTISVDYGFFGTPESSAHEQAAFVVKECWSQCVWSHLVHPKGIENPHDVNCGRRDLHEM